MCKRQFDGLDGNNLHPLLDQIICKDTKSQVGTENLHGYMKKMFISNRLVI